MSHVVAMQAATGGRWIALGDAIRELLANGNLRPSTRAVYERSLEALLDDLGADVPLDRISRARLEAHLRGRYGHCAPATYNRYLATIGSLLTWAVDADHLVVSPAAKMLRRRERCDAVARTSPSGPRHHCSPETVSSSAGRSRGRCRGRFPG